MEGLGDSVCQGIEGIVYNLQAFEGFPGLAGAEETDGLFAVEDQLEVNGGIVHLFLLHLEDGPVALGAQLLPVSLETLQDSALTRLDLRAELALVFSARLAHGGIEIHVLVLLKDLIPELLSARLGDAVLRTAGRLEGVPRNGAHGDGIIPHRFAEASNHMSPMD